MKVEMDPKKRGIGKTVLVVDDSAIIRKALAAAFLSDGFKTCVEAENGKEGIAAAEQFQPDLIVLDLSMPVMNGLQAAPELRKILPKVPIILFTLYGQGLSRSVVSKAGITNPRKNHTRIPAHRQGARVNGKLKPWRWCRDSTGEVCVVGFMSGAAPALVGISAKFSPDQLADLFKHPTARMTAGEMPRSISRPMI